MAIQITLALMTMFALFILFLVISKSIGGIDTSLYKMEYMIRKECDIRLEALEAKYKIVIADRKYDETFNTKQRIADDLQKVTDNNE